MLRWEVFVPFICHYCVLLGASGDSFHLMTTVTGDHALFLQISFKSPGIYRIGTHMSKETPHISGYMSWGRHCKSIWMIITISHESSLSSGWSQSLWFNCICITTRGGMFGKNTPAQVGNPEGGAQGISQGLRLYFTVYADLSHNTDILIF